jgi:hypothetical protein
MGLHQHVGGYEDFWKVEAFLFEFRHAQEHMKKSAAALLDVRALPADKAARKRYDRAHKKMVRLIRDWNRIEQEREK